MRAKSNIPKAVRWYVLHLAVDSAVVDTLIPRGVDAKIPDLGRFYVLHRAVAQRNLSLVRTWFTAHVHISLHMQGRLSAAPPMPGIRDLPTSYFVWTHSNRKLIRDRDRIDISEPQDGSNQSRCHQLLLLQSFKRP